MRRISVIGSAGSGKSKLSQRLADAMGVPFIEMDATFNQPNWATIGHEEFIAIMSQLTEDDGWVVSGNYDQVLEPVVWPRADAVIWLDYSRATVMWRLLRRTLRRGITREELWNGNRESFSRSLKVWDPSVSIIRDVWDYYEVDRKKWAGAMADDRWSSLPFLHLQSPREAERLLADLGRGRA